MATQSRQPAPAYSGFLGRSMVGPEIGKGLRVNRIFRVSDTIANLGAASADNICYMGLPTGAYTYRMLQLSILTPAAIAGDTVLMDGDNVVKTEDFAKYVDWVALEINGREVAKYRASELVALNAYHGIGGMDGNIAWAFGSPNLFWEDVHEDAYLLGTGNIFSAKLLVKTRSNWPSGAKFRLTAEYAPVRRPVGFFMGTTVNEYSFAASGKQTITDVPNGIDFAQIWMIGDGIRSAVLEVDRQIAFEASAQAIKANQAMWGKNPAALPGLMLDGFRDGDCIGFDALTNSDVERKRGADLRLTVDLANPGTTLRIITVHCGLFADQR